MLKHVSQLRNNNDDLKGEDIMGIIASFIVPHPPLIIPDIGRGQERGIQDTIDSFDKVAREIAKIEPEQKNEVALVIDKTVEPALDVEKSKFAGVVWNLSYDLRITTKMIILQGCAWE